MPESFTRILDSASEDEFWDDVQEVAILPHSYRELKKPVPPGQRLPLRIAIYLPNYSSGFHQVVDGILKFQRAHGTYVLKDFRYSPGDLDDLEQRLSPPPWTSRSDGVITFVGRQPGMEEWLIRGKVPVVNTSADRLGIFPPSVHSDAASIASVAADHFLDLGYQEFAYVGYGPSIGNTYREEAYRHELESRGYSLHTWRLQSICDHLIEDPEPILKRDPQLGIGLQSAAKPLAVFCQNDETASAIVCICQKLGLDVPSQVAILGVGDRTTATDCRIPLSSISIPGEAIGWEAMALLHRLISGDNNVPNDTAIPVISMTARGSTLERPVRDRDFDRIIRLIRDRACLGVSVNELVDTLHVSRKTLERKFIDILGHPPGEEIRRVRLARAKELLLTTQLSVTRIGRMTGFDKASLFSRFFLTCTGLSPRDYRRLTQSNEDVFTVPTRD